MTAFTITVHAEEVQAALDRLSERVNNARPVLQGIGDDIVERAKERFGTSTGPDGVPWVPNAQATLDMFAESLGKSYRKKNGEFNSKGEARVAGKKPLIGESRQLSTQIEALAEEAAVSIQSNPVYAAIQQFGGKAGRGHKVTIPARPFLPVHQDGSLYPAEEALIVDALNDWFADGL